VRQDDAFSWAVVLVTSAMFLAALAAVVLAAGCMPRPMDTQVRRVDSLGGVDAVGDELGAEGWRIVDVAALDGGASYVIVLQREVSP
jgi:hypothetical protein